jgi:lipid A 3-O-deacylase
MPRESLNHQRNCRYATEQFDTQRKISPEGWGVLEERLSKTAVFIMVVIGSALAISSEGAETELALAPTDTTSEQPEALATRPARIWQGEVGEGFRSSIQTFSLETGAAVGFAALGGRQSHDLALLSLSYGHMWGGVTGEDHWYRGNWEVRGELFAGAQFSPRSDPLVGLTPHLRYNFATGTRWIPFADLGAGVTASGIGPPDQSGTFEFNLQANIGTYWFLRDNLALTLEVGYLHMSCAGLHEPNLGVNTVKGMLGLTFFF